jgi:O-antigen ligase
MSDTPMIVPGWRARAPLASPLPQLVAGLVGLAGIVTTLVPQGIQVLFIVLAVLAGALYLVRRGVVRPAPGILVPLLAFLLLGLVSLTWTTVPMEGAGQAIAFLYVLGPGLVLIGALGEADETVRQRIERWFVLGLGIGLALYAIEVAFDQPIYRFVKHLDGAKVANIKSMNRAAALFGLLIWPAALVLYRRGRPLLGGAAVVGYLGLSACTSNASAVTGMAVGVPLLGLAMLWPVLARRLMAAALALGFLAAVPVALTLHKTALTREDVLQLSFRHRIEIWNVVGERILEKPLFGWGLDSSRSIPNESDHTDFPQIVHDGNIIPLHPHNLFLQVLLETGIVGAALLLALGLAVLQRLGRWPAPDRAFALALYGTAVTMATFDYGAWQTWRLCGVMLAATLMVVAARPAHRPD